MANKKLTKRGNAIQTELAHELNLHCYPWPTLLGDDRSKWRAVSRMVAAAGRHEHQQHCTGPFPPEMRGMTVPRYEGSHARDHERRMEMAMVHLLAAGIPSWLTEKEE